MPLGLLLALAVLSPVVLSPARATPLTSRLENAHGQLAHLHDTFEIRVERYNAASVRLEGLRKDVAGKRLLVARLNVRIERRQGKAIGLANELYKGGATEPLEAVLSARSLTSAGDNLEYLKSSQAVQRQVFRRLEGDRTVLRLETKGLARDRDRALRAEARLSELKTAIRARLATQRDAVATLERRVAAQKRREQERLAADRALARKRQKALERAAARALEKGAPALLPRGAANFALTTGSTLAATPQALVAVQSALAQVGDPYVWAAAGPDVFDCSGLTSYAWGRAGISLPHSSAMQFTATNRVPSGDWQPGDLLFYGRPIHHVTMYIGHGEMVEAPYTGARVRIASARASDYVGAGRPSASD